MKKLSMYQSERPSHKPMQLASLALAVASVNYLPNAVAQDNDLGFGLLEEIVVTARRREESLQDIPVAVTAMDSEALRSQNIGELSDLGNHVPSLRISNAGASTNDPIISLRGQRPNTAELNQDPAVPMYFADVVMSPSQGTNLAMYDLQSVQVLKGPQGTLFGRNSTGGAVLVQPKAPGVVMGGYIEAELGDYDLQHIEGAVDLPVNDVLQFRLAGRKLERDGYQKNVADNALHGEDYWNEDSEGLRLSTNLELSDRLSNLLVLAYDKNEMLSRVPVPSAFNAEAGLGAAVNTFFNYAGQLDQAIDRANARDKFKVETDVLSHESVENHFAANTTTFDLNENLTLKNIFGYRKLKFESAIDADGTAMPIFGAATSHTESVTYNPGTLTKESEQYSNELQLLGSYDRIDWIVGAYWYEMEATSRDELSQILGLNPEAPAALPAVWIPQQSPNGDVNNKALGLFAEGTYTFNGTWSATLGLRQSWDERSVTARNFTTGSADMFPSFLLPVCGVTDADGNPLPADACKRTVTEDYASPTWRASVNYTPRDGMLMYGSVATGYRSGGIDLRGTDNASLTPYDEETVITYEFGHKADWELPFGSLRTNLAVYLQQYSDIQKTEQAIVDGSFGTQTANAAEAEIKGFEFDVTFAPSADLLINLAYSYVDAGYEKWDKTVTAQDAFGDDYLLTYDNTDAEFTYIPKQSLTGSMVYTLPVDASLGEISVMTSVYWQDDMVSHAESHLFDQLGWSEEALKSAMSTVDVDSYALWNLRLDWRNVMGSNFDLAAYVNNATDEEYIVGGLNVIDKLGFAADAYGAPRTYGASLRYQF